MSELITTPFVEPERFSEPDEDVENGQWYWVGPRDKVADEEEWLGCVVRVGSNYAKLKSPEGGSQRIHFDDFAHLRRERSPEFVIEQKLNGLRRKSRFIMQEIKDLTAVLGVTPIKAIGDGVDHCALSIDSGKDVNDYKKELTLAKDVQLPELFKQLKGVNEEISHWLMADTLPMQAEFKKMEGSISLIEDRIFNVGLYAGLTEEAVPVRKGDTATASDKLHLMQRMHFMDEECLSAYSTGGIECREIKNFDRWISKKEHFTRLFPFPKTALAFRVRRNDKQRSWDGTLMGLLINFELKEYDKITFIYIRNGDRLYRVQTDINFGEKLFPDQSDFKPKEIVAKMFAGRVDEIISRAHFEELLKEHRETEKKKKKWDRENPKKDWFYSPFRNSSFTESDYHHFDPVDVLYDDIANHIGDEIKHYNRVVLIIQGLFDRSECLHPHPPARLWSAEGMEAAVVLVRDSDHALYHGEPPDFEAYRDRLNASLHTGSVAIGQEHFWEVREAEKENERIANDWRNPRTYRHTEFHPYGDPGPGLLARIQKISNGVATFRWIREKSRGKGEVETSLRVPVEKLLNVTDYTPGDFHQFFDDPRTRAQYLKWGAILLAAEEYHAGTIGLSESSSSIFRGHREAKKKGKKSR